MINCICCYVIKSAGETANKVLLSVIWNILLIEINLSQIRTSDSKREKVCAVWQYLLFTYIFLFEEMLSYTIVLLKLKKNASRIRLSIKKLIPSAVLQ